ncbi:MAG: signal peptide peptidase SppA [Candidatus Altiarchaeales archaeon]|nr:signal peptide peptidase SppA [Candidatus Altiarchaeales archaeon]MBD3415623.1 signal peptide peptidase SppA [Candidatus Altiarchaeales archaeon]
MKTFWKVVVTFAVLGLFVMVVAFSIAALLSGFNVPELGTGGDVAVIPIHGTITMGSCPGSLLYMESCAQVDTIKKQLRDADKDPTVKAIVLDVYSGGGNVVASRELMRAVRNTKKPVVAWIGEVGASGAYYAASASDRIVADENSITGSIGVVTFIQHYYELLDEIGVNVTVIKAGKSKDIGSPFRPMTEDEEAEMQRIIDIVYDSFVSDVAENRDMTVEEVESVAQGSIYLGVEAKENGLIDELGGIDHAIAVAGELGGIKGEPGVRKPERKLTWADLLR